MPNVLIILILQHMDHNIFSEWKFDADNLIRIIPSKSIVFEIIINI